MDNHRANACSSFTKEPPLFALTGFDLATHKLQSLPLGVKFAPRGDLGPEG
jgi:hypothetical protein